METKEGLRGEEGNENKKLYQVQIQMLYDECDQHMYLKCTNKI